MLVKGRQEISDFSGKNIRFKTIQEEKKINEGCVLPVNLDTFPN